MILATVPLPDNRKLEPGYCSPGNLFWHLVMGFPKVPDIYNHRARSLFTERGKTYRMFGSLK